MRNKLINEITFWSHVHKTAKSRKEYTAAKDFQLQQLFNDRTIKSKIVFIDPIEALPEGLKERKRELYAAYKNGAGFCKQKRELEKLETLIWEQESFSCKKNCKFAEKLFDPTTRDYPTIRSVSNTNTPYEVRALSCILM